MNNTKVQSIIEKTVLSALNTLIENEIMVNDLFVQVDPTNGEFQVYDENENLLDKVIIFDWINKRESEQSFNTRVSGIIKSALISLQEKDAFERSNLMKPLSVSLTTEDFSVIEELLFLDEEFLRFDDPILKDMDKDLNDFLDKLFSDMK